MKNINFEQKFMNDINLLKVIAIILVVIGHSTNQYTGNWVIISENKSIFFSIISDYVNSFHMQLFVLIAGIVYAYCRIQKGYYSNYKELAIAKLNRLIKPYFIFGLLYMIPIELILNIRNISTIQIFVNFLIGHKSGHLWFLMMLFIVFIIYYKIEKQLKSRQIINISLFILIQIISLYIPTLFFINRALYYMFFFYLGCTLYSNQKFLENISRKIIGNTKLIVLLIIILGLTIIELNLLKNNVIPKKSIGRIMILLVENFVAIMGIYQMYLTLFLVKRRQRKWVKLIKKYNFNIYLLHQPIIFIILYFLKDIVPFVVVIICFVGGLMIPIWLTKLFDILFAYKLRIRDREVIKGE